MDFHSLLILMVVVWLAGKFFRMLGLPVILGELIGGIIVGPIGLAIVMPDSEVIKILAELGIFFLMLHSGLENDPKTLIKAGKKSILVALGGILIPLISIYFVARGFNLSVTESLFVGMTLSVTAIAISIRILKDCKIHKTKTAQIAIGAAVVTDIVALIMFSVLLNVIETGVVEVGAILLMIFKLIMFFGIVIVGGLKVQKHFNKFFKSKGFTLTLILALGLGLIAEWIGLHIIIGAFLAGLFIREEILDDAVFRKIEDRIYGLSYSFLGPIFFASLAFHLDFRAVISQPWFILILLITVMLAKFIGTTGAALLQKINRRQAIIIGVAMNSKGAVDLIIASIGLQKGIIGPEVFSIIVSIAFLSTLIAIVAIKPMAKYAR